MLDAARVVEASFTAVCRTVIQTITISRVLQIHHAVVVSACIAFERAIKKVADVARVPLISIKMSSASLYQVSLNMANVILRILHRRSDDRKNN